jgi:pimeloyl-ACP methyl ester carboxylesterase
MPAPARLEKRTVRVGDASVAYYDVGRGPPVLFLHGCPFSAFVWRHVIAGLSSTHRCLAPDLLGLGDTETPVDADWSLRAQAAMIVGFLDALDVPCLHVVGHDHGGAVAQLLAAEHPHRIERLVLSNVEAYDNWPSAEERPFVRLAQLPLVGDLALRIWALPRVLRFTLTEAKAVYDARVLTPELIVEYSRVNFGDRHRRAKTKRFLALQFDPRNNAVTLDLLDGLRRFTNPTLLLWAENDPHFGPEWATRLAADIPGVQRIELLPETGHLLMEERPALVAAHVGAFLA